MLIEAFEGRSDGDYEDDITFTAKEVEALFETMTEYIATLKDFIHHH